MMKENVLDFLTRSHTAQTANTYIYTIDIFLATNPNARNYQYHDLVKYFEKLRKKYPKASTRIRILSAIKRYYDYLIETGYRIDHPCQYIQIRTDGPKQNKSHDLFSMEEMESLLSRPNRYKDLGLRNKSIISILIYQGVTSGELLKLRVEDINLDIGTVYVRKSTRLNNRTLKLKPSQILLLNEYISNSRKKLLKKEATNALFLSKLGNPIDVDGLHAMIEPLKGLYPDRSLCPKKIRMSVISYWLNDKEIPINDVMLLSGNKWPSSIELYKKPDTKKSRNIINQFHPLG